MKIAYEGRWMNRGPISGRVLTRGYLQGFYENLSSGDTIDVLTNNNGTDHNFDSRVSFYNMPSSNPLLVAGALVPYYAWKRNCDYALFQFVAPFTRLRKVRTATIVYDVIVEEHPEYFSQKEKFLLKVLKHNCKNVDIVFAISEYTRQQLIRFKYADEKNVYVSYCGFPIGRGLGKPTSSNVLPKLSISNPYCLYVGRLNPRKNLDRLVKAFLERRSHYPHDLIIVGESDPNFEDFRGQLTPDEAKRVIFLGRVSSEDLTELYLGASLFVYVPFLEGFGLPILESLNYGVPCLTSNTSSLPEVGGEACHYVDPRSQSEIGQAIELLLTDQETLGRLRRNIPAQIKKFDWTSTAKMMLGILAERT